jgi:hypothetical protein
LHTDIFSAKPTGIGMCRTAYFLAFLPLADRPKALRLYAIFCCQARNNGAKYCLLSRFRLGYRDMKKAEIKHIADYLKDLEEGLYEWD